MDKKTIDKINKGMQQSLSDSQRIKELEAQIETTVYDNIDAILNNANWSDDFLSRHDTYIFQMFIAIQLKNVCGELASINQKLASSDNRQRKLLDLLEDKM